MCVKMVKRQFHMMAYGKNIYSKAMIGETVFTQFKNLPSTETFASKYQTVLPSKEELQRRLNATESEMQSAYIFYILGLNLILATFSDQAVTALGLYYKWQTFFFIPLGAMQTCIVGLVYYRSAMSAEKKPHPDR